MRAQPLRRGLRDRDRARTASAAPLAGVSSPGRTGSRSKTHAIMELPRELSRAPHELPSVLSAMLQLRTSQPCPSLKRLQMLLARYDSSKHQISHLLMDPMDPGPVWER